MWTIKFVFGVLMVSLFFAGQSDLLAQSVIQGSSTTYEGDWMTGPNSSYNADTLFENGYRLWTTDQGFPVPTEEGDALRLMVFGDSFYLSPGLSSDDLEYIDVENTPIYIECLNTAETPWNTPEFCNKWKTPCSNASDMNLRFRPSTYSITETEVRAASDYHYNSCIQAYSSDWGSYCRWYASQPQTIRGCDADHQQQFIAPNNQVCT